MRDLPNNTLRQCVVSDEFDGQRLDNYLLREWRGVPRSLVYRLIRSGHVRVNAGRVRPDRRLHSGDRLRLPASVAIPAKAPPRPLPPLQLPVLYEDAMLLAVDKPAGVAVHGGSGLSHGVIEQLRGGLARQTFLELAHRLDRNTSGVLLLAKKRSALAEVQRQWRASQVRKHYVALVLGRWQRAAHQTIALPLKRVAGGSGVRQVVVSEAGKAARTTTKLIRQYQHSALLGAALQTGRTHQLRVHFAAGDLPILGDDKYGRFDINHAAARAGYKRMFLHADRLEFKHPHNAETLTLTAPVPPDFEQAAAWLDSYHN